MNSEQAEKFLPAAGEQLSGAASGGGLASLLGGGGIEGVLEQVDVTALAQQVGIEPDMARKALDTIVPKLMEAMQQGGGGLLGGVGSKLLGG